MSPRSNGTTALAERTNSKDALAQLEQVVIQGDLAKLSPEERIAYYARVTESLGINPLTRPFEYITLNGRMVLYARKDATDQLRSIKGISVDRLDREQTAELAIVTAYGHDRAKRTDSAIGAVPIKGLAGEGLANALMKAETKAKRRMTLSLAGLGWLDETEIGSVEEGPGASGPVVTTRREAVAARVAALPEANEEAAYVGTEVDVDDIPFDSAARRQGDPWMRKVHAVGAERGMDHQGIHDLAVDKLGVTSLNDLTPYQRADLMEILSASEQPQQVTTDQEAPGSQADGSAPAAASQASGGLATPGAGEQSGAGDVAPAPDAPIERVAPAASPPGSPAPPDSADPDPQVEAAVWGAAVAHGIVAADAGVAGWEAIDAIAEKVFNKDRGVILRSELTELAVRITAGEFDPSPPRPRRAPAPKEST